MCTVDLAQCRRILVLQECRAPAHHALPRQRRSSRPSRALCLSARRRHRRVLVGLLAAGGQRPGQGEVSSAATASLTRSFPATIRTSMRSRRCSSPSTTTSSCGMSKIRNTGAKPRRLSVFAYVEFSFHHIEIDNQNLQMSLYASGSNYEDGVIEYDFFYEPWTFHYFAGNFDPDSYDTMRDSFLGNYRTETNPLAVERGQVQRQRRTGRQSLRGVAEEADARARRRISAGLHAGRGPAGQRKRDQGQVFRSWPTSTASLPR